jgi:hypothetical protein
MSEYTDDGLAPDDDMDTGEGEFNEDDYMGLLRIAAEEMEANDAEPAEPESGPPGRRTPHWERERAFRTFLNGG